MQHKSTSPLALCFPLLIAASLGSSACSVLVNSKKALQGAKKVLKLTPAKTSLTSATDVASFYDTNELKFSRIDADLFELADGRIYIVGGAERAETDIFDPAGNGGLGTLTSGPAMNVARGQLTFTRLNDGRILAVGGYITTSTGAVTTVEIFDPSANGGVGAWSLGPDLPLKRYAHTATKLSDGRVLIAGGRSTGATNTSTVFDPAANSGAGGWTDVVATMPAGTYDGQRAILLDDGRVMVSGGTQGGWSTSTAYFNAAANSGNGGWTSGPAMGIARWLHQITRLDDGRYLFSGGSNGSGYTTSVQYFDPAGNAGAGAFSAATALPVGQANHRTILLDDDRVLLIGNNGTSANYIFDRTGNAGAGSWTVVTSTPTSQRNYAGIHKFANGTVMVVGGSKIVQSQGLQIKNLELFDPDSSTWQTLVGALPVSKSIYYTAVALDDGRALFIGGLGYSGYQKSMAIFDPAANDGAGEFSPGTEMSVVRAGATAIKLSDGRVMMAGGSPGGVIYTSLNTVEFLDPGANSGAGAWTAGANMPSARTNYKSVVLTDGRVLLLGGNTNQSTANSTPAIFDPAGNSGAGTWAAAPAPLVAARVLSYSTLVALADGTALLFGGNQATAEIFDPDGNAGAGEWTMTGSTATTKVMTSALRLSDDRVLIAGGARHYTTDHLTRMDTEIYDPSQGTWSSGPAMLAERADQALVQHPNGLVYTFGGLQSSVWIVTPATSMEVLDFAANAGAGEWTTLSATLDAGDYRQLPVLMDDGRIRLHSTTNFGAYDYVTLFENTTLTVAGGIPPYTAGILSGDGVLTVDATTGNMTLMPTNFGTIKIQMTDGRGVTGTVEIPVN